MNNNDQQNNNTVRGIPAVAAALSPGGSWAARLVSRDPPTTTTTTTAWSPWNSLLQVALLPVTTNEGSTLLTAPWPSSLASAAAGTTTSSGTTTTTTTSSSSGGWWGPVQDLIWAGADRLAVVFPQGLVVWQVERGVLGYTLPTPPRLVRALAASFLQQERKKRKSTSSRGDHDDDDEDNHDEEEEEEEDGDHQLEPADDSNGQAAATTWILEDVVAVPAGKEDPADPAATEFRWYVLLREPTSSSSSSSSSSFGSSTQKKKKKNKCKMMVYEYQALTGQLIRKIKAGHVVLENHNDDHHPDPDPTLLVRLRIQVTALHIVLLVAHRPASSSSSLLWVRVLNRTTGQRLHKKIRLLLPLPEDTDRRHVVVGRATYQDWVAFLLRAASASSSSSSDTAPPLLALVHGPTGQTQLLPLATTGSRQRDHSPKKTIHRKKSSSSTTTTTTTTFDPENPAGPPSWWWNLGTTTTTTPQSPALQWMAAPHDHKESPLSPPHQHLWVLVYGQALFRLDMASPPEKSRASWTKWALLECSDPDLGPGQVASFLAGGGPPTSTGRHPVAAAAAAVELIQLVQNNRASSPGTTGTWQVQKSPWPWDLGAVPPSDSQEPSQGLEAAPGIIRWSPPWATWASTTRSEAPLDDDANPKKRKIIGPATTVMLGPGRAGQEARRVIEGVEAESLTPRSHPMDDREEEDEEEGLTIADRLQLLQQALGEEDDLDDQEDDKGPEGADDREENKAAKSSLLSAKKDPAAFVPKKATTESLTQLLQQAMQSGDDVMLELALAVRDTRIIEQSCRQLPDEALSALLAALTHRLSTKPGRAEALCCWLTVLLKTGSVRSVAQLQPLRNLLQERLEIFPAFLKLEGRLSMLESL